MPAKNGILVLRKKSEIDTRGHLAISATNLREDAVQVPRIKHSSVYGELAGASWYGQRRVGEEG